MKDKIVWRKPDYKNKWGKVNDKDIDKYCIEGDYSGDIIIKRSQYGRKISFVVYRVEKVGELVEGIDTLTRQRAIEELKKLSKNDVKQKQDVNSESNE